VHLYYTLGLLIEQTEINTNRYGNEIITPDGYDRVVYLGRCVVEGDVFAAYSGKSIEVMYGILGDEFK